MVVVGADTKVLAEVAERVAVEAAELVAEARRAIARGEPVAVESKTAETDVVTAADQQAERFIRDRLAELRPTEPVLGEEQGHDGSTPGADGTVTWVVDPIDGTVNFLYGFPWFAVSVAAQIDGQSVAGAVVEPVSGRRWTAARGTGAWLDGVRLAVSHPERLALTLCSTGFAYQAQRRRRQAAMVAQLLGHVRDIRRSGSAALDLCAVAAGWCDAHFEHGLSRWDWAAGALIAAEAGAVVTVPGQNQTYGADATFAAAPAIAEPLREALRKCGVGTV